MSAFPGEERWRPLVEQCLRREIGSQASIPPRDHDLLKTGVLDSMAWVSFIRSLESAAGINDLGAALGERTVSLENLFRALDEAGSSRISAHPSSSDSRSALPQRHVFLVGSSSEMGSRSVSPEEVDRAFGMPAGKLRSRAGIESLAYAAEGEDELTLAARAIEKALRRARCSATDLDWIICTSETHRGYPSLAARLHSQLLARENCGALDVGGACLGLLNGLAVAQALISSGQARTVLAATADVHTRVLTPSRVAGEFGGLFGDGASAFVLRAAEDAAGANGYCLGKFSFGCAGQYAGAIGVTEAGAAGLEVHFDGEALSRAAVTRLAKVIVDVESRSGIPGSSVAGLATHQPNPRLVALLARECRLPESKFPPVARQFGNLGSSTCGVALDLLLEPRGDQPAPQRGPIYMASLGPGLLFGGGWLFPAPGSPA